MINDTFNTYTVSIKGLKRSLENPDIKPLWLYVVDHYDKLDNKGMKDKLDNFNTTVLDFLYEQLERGIFSKEALHKIGNIARLNYSAEMVNSECTAALKETILAELKRLPEYVSEQVIVILLAYLQELNIGLKFTQKKNELVVYKQGK